MASAIVAVSVYTIVGSLRTKGVVGGILYTIDNSSVMIDGQLLKEGDTIYGVKVIRIYQNKVEFKKAGQRWTQRVRERPDPAWDEPERVILNVRNER